MTRRALLSLIVGSLFAAGCGSSFSLSPVIPQRVTVVGPISVEIDPSVDGKKRRILEKLAVLGHMHNALTNSFPAGNGPALRVTITSFRTGGFGPTKMHARAELLDEGGRPTRIVDANSTTIKGGRTSARVQRVSQDIVNKLALQFL